MSIPSRPEPPGSETLEDPALSQLVGGRLRQARKDAGLSLRALAKRSGLSIGFLSQVERGLSSTSLAALKELAAALDLDIRDFFGDSAPTTPARLPSSFTLTRATGENTREYVSGARSYRMLSQRGPDMTLEPMLVHIAPGGEPEESYGHPGEEFAYVLSGELVYTVDGVAHRLRPGDSVHLRSEVPHSLHNDSSTVCTVVSVVTPRMF